MEELLKKNNLSVEEKKNVFLAVACGCMTAITEEIEGPPHMRKKRKCIEFRTNLLKFIGPVIPRVRDSNMGLFIDTIGVSDKVLKNIMETHKSQLVHVLLNLTAFCLEELPLKKNHWEEFKSLFTMWPDAYEYKDTRSGHRIFERIDTEVQILVRQRGGVIL